VLCCSPVTVGVLHTIACCSRESTRTAWRTVKSGYFEEVGDGIRMGLRKTFR
jgi:hypothetical protein